ncbi:hypothetical protein DEFR109230_11880 [Deinococcus frigens]
MVGKLRPVPLNHNPVEVEEWSAGCVGLVKSASNDSVTELLTLGKEGQAALPHRQGQKKPSPQGKG